MMVSVEPDEDNSLLVHAFKTVTLNNWICSEDAEHITSETLRLMSIRLEIGCFKVIRCGVFSASFYYHT